MFLLDLCTRTMVCFTISCFSFFFLCIFSIIFFYLSLIFLNRSICAMSAPNWWELTQCIGRLGSILPIAYIYRMSNIFDLWNYLFSLFEETVICTTLISGDLCDMKEASFREALYVRERNKGCYMYYFVESNLQWWWVWVDFNLRRDLLNLTCFGIP